MLTQFRNLFFYKILFFRELEGFKKNMLNRFKKTVNPPLMK